MDRYLIVLAGAGLGGVARYAAGAWIAARYPGRFPLATLLINVTGSFLIGIAMTLLTERGLHPYWRLFAVVGILGGYTTFSTFEYEAWGLAREGEYWPGLIYVITSVVAGYLAVWIGAVLAARR